MKSPAYKRWQQILDADPFSTRARRYEKIRESEKEILFEWAERLDTVSRRAALEILDLGPDVLASQGEAEFARWAEMGLAAGERSGEMSARALDAGRHVLGRLSEEASERWLETGLRLAEASERVGRVYFEQTGTLLAHGAGLDPQVWGSAVLPLLEAGWQARQLAADFLEKTAPVAGQVGAEGLGIIAGAAARIARRHTPTASAWLDEGPALIGQTPPECRPALGRMLLAAAQGASPMFAELARLASVAAVEMLRYAPAVLEIAANLYEKTPDETLELLRGKNLLVQLGKRHGEAWEEGTRLAVQTAVELSGVMPKAGAALLKSIPELRRLATPEELPRWIEEGKRHLQTSEEKATAYFSLASRAARAQLRAYGEGVSFTELSRPMALFAQGMCGRRVSLAVQSSEPAEDDLATLEERRPMPTTDGLKIYLPELFWGFGTRTMNRKAARLATAHQAGHLEYGTFLFDAEALARKKSPITSLDRFEPASKANSGLAWFFSRFGHEALARDFFATFEGYRIDARIRREYRGLTGDLEWLWQQELARRPTLESVTRSGGALSLLSELLLRRSLGATDLPAEIATEDPPSPDVDPAEWALRRLELAQLWDDLGAFMDSLARPGASVEDSAMRAAELYHLTALFLGAGLKARQMAVTAEPGEEPPALRLPQGTVETGTPQPSAEIPPELMDSFEGAQPVAHRGEMDPAAAQELLEMQQALQTLDRAQPAAAQMTAAELQAFLEAHPEIEELAGGSSEGGGFLAGFLDSEHAAKPGEEKDFPGSLEKLDKLRERLSLRMAQEESSGFEELYLYDEWDHSINDYRASWCTVREREAPEADLDAIEHVLTGSAQIVRDVIRQFERIRPEMIRRERAQMDGEEIDLGRAIEALADRKQGLPWPERLYERRVKAERDVATMLLIDMSASTGEKVLEEESTAGQDEGGTDYWWEAPAGGRVPGKSALLSTGSTYTVLDIQKEAVLVMGKALQFLGDACAIYGFSGHGREHVDIYRIKDFEERHEARILRRIAGIRPKQSTRMGAAIRHATWRLAQIEARYKSLILISDGYPQDTDYGSDRRDETYALLDTRAALEESERAGIHPFCVTVDKAGYDYLRKMSPHESYLVIDKITDLPKVLPRVYRRITR